MSIKIIKTTDTHLLAKLNHDVQELHHNIEPEIFRAYSEENMKKLFDEALTDENVTAYIAYYEDRLAGYLLLTKKDHIENYFKNSYSVIHIDQICIEKEFRGKGIGKALVEFAKEYAKTLNISRLEMNYWSKNENSGEFFRSQGFKTFNERLAIEL